MVREIFRELVEGTLDCPWGGGAGALSNSEQLSPASLHINPRAQS